MNYTKGEWKVVEPEIEPQRLIIDCRWQEGGKNYHRSICRTFGYCDTKEEELANANLIAAAPDMYEALKNIIADYDDLNCHQVTAVSMGIADAAIIKAESKQ